MTGRFKQLALRELPPALRYWLLGWIIGSLICVVVRPFATEDLGILSAVAYWFGINGIATAVMFGILRIFNTPDEGRFALRSVLGSFVFTLVFSPILILVNDALFGIGVRFGLFITNFIIALLIFCIVGVALTLRGQKETVALPKFENRLSRFQTAQLWAVSAQDHYLNVQTDQGSELILMRLSDALSELAGHDGIKIHRSHWVARAGAVKTSNTYVTLQSGENLPISRGNLSEVKAFFSRTLPLNI